MDDDQLPVGDPGAGDGNDDRAAVYRRARSIGGLPGAVLAGALMGVKDVLQPVRDEPAIMSQADGEPHDIDEDGIEFDLGDQRRAVTPPLPPVARVPVGRSRRRRRR